MPPSPPHRSSIDAAAPLAWVFGIAAAVAIIFASTTRSLIDHWSRSDAWSHGFLIVPIAAAIAWSRRDRLQALAPRPDARGAAALCAAAALWLLGEALAAAAPAQIALVAMVAAALWTIAGIAWLRALAFPLAFLFFAVPVGDALVPPMIDATADVTVWALVRSGIPVFRDGTNFSIPSGDWSVVEACSGVRYLFAGLALATLYAWLVYSSWRKQVIFVFATLAALVVANWLRAYAIVMIAHYSDNRLAAGIDHFVYGAVFFGVVMAAAFAVGGLWRDEPRPPGDAAAVDARRAVAAREAPVTAGIDGARRRALAAAALTALLLASLSLALQRGGDAPSAVQLPATIAAPAGWVHAPSADPAWQPYVHNPIAVRAESFERDARRVTVQWALFGRPTPESKVFSSMHRPLPGDDRQPWRLVQRDRARVAGLGGDPPRAAFAVDTAVLVGRGGRLTAWQWYWVDGTHTASAYEAALRQLLARLAGRSERALLVTIHTIDPKSDPQAAEVLAGFVRDARDVIDAALRNPRPD